MEGNTKFEDALAARLGIIQPSRAAIEQCLQDTPLQLSPGVDRLIASLSKRGTHVYLVSGGFRIMIEPIAGFYDYAYCTSYDYKNVVISAVADPNKRSNKYAA